jgi:hypothetical protein
MSSCHGYRPEVLPRPCARARQQSSDGDPQTSLRTAPIVPQAVRGLTVRPVWAAALIFRVIFGVRPDLIIFGVNRFILPLAHALSRIRTMVSRSGLSREENRATAASFITMLSPSASASRVARTARSFPHASRSASPRSPLMHHRRRDQGWVHACP